MSKLSALALANCQRSVYICNDKIFQENPSELYLRDSKYLLFFSADLPSDLDL